MPVFSISSSSILLVIVRLAPAPITKIGDFAASMARTAASTALESANGRRA